MKKLIVILAALLVLVGCSSDDRPVLRIYNWGAYIDEDVLTQFEEEYSVRIQYDLYQSNEEMYTKLSGESYDIVIPSDYMIQRLVEEDRLQMIDYTKIPNYVNIDDAYKGRHFDPNNEYAVPYFVGSVGIVYNTEVVSEDELNAEGWDILKNAKYKDRAFFYNSERDGFMIALKSLGYSMNTSNEQELQEAFDWLIDMKRAVSPVFVDDLVINAMEAGEKDLAVMYSGDAAYVLSENDTLGYYEPYQGTNVWVDAMVIPKDAQNVDAAHQFINFVSDPEISQLISEEVGYTSPIKGVVDALTAPGGAFEGIGAYIPRTGYEMDEEFFYNAETKQVMGGLWNKVHATK